MTRMIKWGVPALAACALMTTAAQAQAIRPGPSLSVTAESGLTVHGHSEMKVRPDVAYVDVGVVTQSQDSTQAVRDNATRSTALLAALKGAGLADRDLQSQSYSVQPQYDYQSSPARLTGYQVTNSVRATVRDLTKVGPVIDAATGAGGNQVNGVTFDLADRTQAEGRALAMAVVEARAKAAVMAQAAGVPLGRLVDLSEGDAPTFQPLVLEAQGVTRMAARAPSTPIQSQDISITADVTAVYGLGL